MYDENEWRWLCRCLKKPETAYDTYNMISGQKTYRHMIDMHTDSVGKRFLDGIDR